MVILKWVIDEEYYDEERGIDNFGHWEEVELDDEQVEEAVKDHLRTELHVDNKFDIDQLYDDIAYRVDVKEAYAEEIASYFGGKVK